MCCIRFIEFLYTIIFELDVSQLVVNGLVRFDSNRHHARSPTVIERKKKPIKY